MKTERLQCRHGTFTFFPDDEFVGKSLAMYGEYSEEEVRVMEQILRPGDVAIEVGANIGTLTVPMARLVASAGRVIAYEPQPENAALLLENLKQNDVLDLVEVRQVAAGDAVGTAQIPRLNELMHHNYGRVEIGGGSHTVPVERIDDLHLESLKFLKIDAEGSELAVIQGAAETIKRCRPYLYVENDRQEKSAALIGAIMDLGYRLFWHMPPLYRHENFFKEVKNVFGDIVSINMGGFPEESKAEIINSGGEVNDHRIGPEMYDREIARCRRILKHHPGDVAPMMMIAHCHNLMQRDAEAQAAIAEVLALDPDNIHAHMTTGLHSLQKRKWKEGWKGYEIRYKQRETHKFGDRPHIGERWDGTPTDAPTLLWCEQGFGDTIMFGRPSILGEALRRLPNAFVEVPAQLYELFEHSKVVPEGRLFRMRRSLPPYEKHCSIPSLPYVLGLNTDEQLRCAPYLKPDQALVDFWLSRKTPPKIGVCWSGSTNSERPYSRDIDHNLLRDITARHGPFISLVQQGQFESYAETAGLVGALDLVISVDTSVIHLAGALGKETWLLLSYDPDWRWGLQGEQSVWYDSVRIFRQPAFMDWTSVVKEVEAALDARASLSLAA